MWEVTHACVLVASDSFLVIQFDPNTMEFSTCCDFFFFPELSFWFVCGLLLFRALFLLCVMISEQPWCIPSPPHNLQYWLFCAALLFEIWLQSCQPRCSTCHWPPAGKTDNARLDTSYPAKRRGKKMSQRCISSVAVIKINLAHLQGFFLLF